MALGQILLLGGQLDEGWHHYDARWLAKSVPIRPRNFDKPLWGGQHLYDQVLLVHCEQGFGDTIQFCRYVARIASRVRVVLEVQRPLIPLLSSIAGVEKIVASGDALPFYDYHCPLLSLPRIEGTTLGTIPGSVPYLTPQEDRVNLWRQKLKSIQGLKVGLTWAGGSVTPRNNQRSIAIDRLSILAGVPNITFVSLQKYQSRDTVCMPPEDLSLIDHTASLVDFADTAALVETLDLVISVDTAVAHLAGALGKATWLLNRFSPCWRWLLGRDDSPWYPTLRQFRQPAPDDWESVLLRVRRELEQLSAADSAIKSKETGSRRRGSR